MQSQNLITEIPFNLPGKIFRSPMAFSSYDRLGQVMNLYRVHKINVVVVLTEPQEYLVHAARDLPSYYRSIGLDVIQFPIEDYNVPEDRGALGDTVHTIIKKAESGDNIAIHCMAGLGRTGLFLACMAQTILGLSGVESIDWIRSNVPGALENETQEKFVHDYRDYQQN